MCKQADLDFPLMYAHSAQSGDVCNDPKAVVLTASLSNVGYTRKTERDRDHIPLGPYSLSVRLLSYSPL